MSEQKFESDRQKYGLLLTPDIKLYRQYFKEMVKLIGVNVWYQAPTKSKNKDLYGELDTKYDKPILVGCIFEEYPDQQTVKKIGWVSELEENSSIIHLPYDLPGLQEGALVIVPSALDNAHGRLFRIIKLSTTMIYPSSIPCEIAPEYQNTFVEAQHNYENTNFNLLDSEEDEYDN